MDTTNLFSVTASDSTRHAGDATGLHSSRRMHMRTHQENRRTNEPTHGEHLALPVTHADSLTGGLAQPMHCASLRITTDY